MSFAEQVKDELARVVPTEVDARRAELTALLRMGGSLVMGNGGAGIRFVTHHNPTARKMLTYVKATGGIVPQVMVRRGNKLRKKNVYTLTILPGPIGQRFLEELGLLPVTEIRDDEMFRGREVRRAYLAGAFLGGGSVNRPQGDYHLEFVTESIAFATTLVSMLKTFRLQGRIVERKDDYIVYLKTGESVARLLQIMGADQALLEFENVRVLKDMRNQVNRVVNCETANLQKTVDAAVRQLRDIELIRSVQPLHTLPPRLKEAAELRLAHPDVPLRELAGYTDKKMTKSGLYHRFRKLSDLADALRAQGQDRRKS